MSDKTMLTTISPPWDIRLYHIIRFTRVIWSSYEWYFFLLCFLGEYLYVGLAKQDFIKSSIYNADYSPLFSPSPVIAITVILPFVYLAVTYVLGRSQSHILSAKQLLKSIVDNCDKLYNGIQSRKDSYKKEDIDSILRFPELLRVVLIQCEYVNRFSISNGYRDPSKHDKSLFIIHKDERDELNGVTIPKIFIRNFEKHIREKILPRKTNVHEQQYVRDEFFLDNNAHLTKIIDQAQTLANLEPEHTGPETFIAFMLAVYFILFSIPYIFLSYLSWLLGTFYGVGAALVIIGFLEGARTRNLSTELSLSVENYEWYYIWYHHNDNLINKRTETSQVK